MVTIQRFVGFVFIALASCATPPNAPAPRGAPFNRDAFFREADRFRKDAEQCRQPGQSEGRSEVRFVYRAGVAEPAVSFEYGMHGGSPDADCVLRLAKMVRVPPFEGKPESFGVGIPLGDGPPEGMFDRGGVAHALGDVNVQPCYDGREIYGHAKITFAPDGSVLRTVMDQPSDIAGTAFATCIEGAFRAVHVRPYAGSPVTVGKTFSVRAVRWRAPGASTSSAMHVRRARFAQRTRV